MPFATISLARAEVVFNGHRVNGFSADGEAITFPEITLAETERGADGKLLAQATADQGGEVMLKLMPQAVSAAYFFQQFTAIMQGALVTWRASVNYGRVRVEMYKGVMTKGPSGQTIGKASASALEWTFDFERIISNYAAVQFDNAPSITGTPDVVPTVGT